MMADNKSADERAPPGTSHGNSNNNNNSSSSSNDGNNDPGNMAAAAPATTPQDDAEAERKLVAKLDRHLVPLVMLLYTFSFLDRCVS